MGDIQKQQLKQQQQQQEEEEEQSEEEQVFGAPDEVGATKRQICGAAIAGGVAGAFLGPVSAVTMATASALAAAKRECEIGEAARTVGDVVCDSSAKILTEEAVDKTVEGSCRRATLVVQQCSMRASQGANGIQEKLSRTKEKCSLKASQIKDKVGQMKDQVGQVKEKVSTSLARRKNRKKHTGSAEGEEEEFHDCHDDDDSLEDGEEEFEDAVECDE